jgi:hypothetical protein
MREDRLPRTRRNILRSTKASIPPPTHLFIGAGPRVARLIGRKIRQHFALSSLRVLSRTPVTLFPAAFDQTMGKIRIALFRDSPAGHAQEDVKSSPRKIAKAHTQPDEDEAQELEGLPSYPTQPKTARFDQLPFIAADEVVKRDGTRGSDICMLDCHPLAKQKRL